MVVQEKKKMGRPSLGKKKMLITMPPYIKEKLETLSTETGFDMSYIVCQAVANIGKEKQ